MSTQSASAPRVSIIVPTYNRHDGLERCVSSLFALTDPELTTAELIIADNSPDANAQQVFARLRHQAPIPTKYVSETTPGVANVRNTALKHASSSLILWLDDDQSVDDGWLTAFLADYDAYNAAVTFGPIRTELPAGAQHRYPEYFKRYFERAQLESGGIIDHYYGCGNSLFDLAQIYTVLPQHGDIFPVEANDSGGEDDRVFQQLEKHGKSFGWCHEGWANEHPPLQRVKLEYTFKRSFVYGQGPISDARYASPPKVLSVLFWMGVGLGQAGVYGTVALALRLIGSDKWVGWGDKTMRGIGKVLWFPPFNLQFYGTAYQKRNKSGEENNGGDLDAEKRSQPAN